MPVNIFFKNRSFIYVIAVISVCIIIGCISFIKVDNISRWYIIVVCELAAFMLVGIFHVWLSRNAFAKFSIKSVYGFRNTALLSAGIFASLAILYTIVNFEIVVLSLAGGAIFILPYAIAYAYNVFETIPDRQYKLWYKRDNLLDNKAFVFLASVSLKIKLAPAIADKKYMVFKSTLPAQMELGRAFHFFLIQQQNDDVFIEAKDGENEPVGWQFYLEKFWGYKLIPLNPDFNLWENQVRPRSTVVAKRVMFSSKIVPFQFQKNSQHELYQY